MQESRERERHGVCWYLCQHFKGWFELFACEVVIQQLLICAARSAGHGTKSRKPTYSHSRVVARAKHRARLRKPEPGPRPLE